MTLYHYCGNASFLSILESKEIWTTDLTLSNDHMEGRWIRHVFSQLCEQHKNLSRNLRELLKEMDFLINFFGATGFCLSEEYDQLSQWRGYADDGSGVCIGFSRESLGKLRGNENFGVVLQKVIYERTEQEKLISPFLDSLQKEVENGAFRSPVGNILIDISAEEKTAINAAHRRLSLSFLTMLPYLFALKNPAFTEEREWRLLTTLIKPNLADGELGGLEFHALPDRIMPVRRVSIADDFGQTITRVVLGPKNITPEKIISAALAKYGFKNVEVLKSSASYR